MGEGIISAKPQGVCVEMKVWSFGVLRFIHLHRRGRG